MKIKNKITSKQIEEFIDVCPEIIKEYIKQLEKEIIQERIKFSEKHLEYLDLFIKYSNLKINDELRFK